MSNNGFYSVLSPMDASYEGMMVVTIAMPARDEAFNRQLRTEFALLLARNNIHHSGRATPYEALKARRRIEERKERAS